MGSRKTCPRRYALVNGVSVRSTRHHTHSDLNCSDALRSIAPGNMPASSST